MSTQVQLRRDTATNIGTFTGKQGECVVDTTNNRLVVQDGATAGGFPAAKLSEVVSAKRTAISDTIYTVLVSDRIVAYTSLTAARNVTLPAASAFPVGVPLWIIDESGACSGTLYIAINRAGSDTIDGATSATLNGAYQGTALESNGVNGWTIIGRNPNESLTALGIGTPSDSTNPLSVKATQALFNAISNSFTVYINKAASGNNAAVLFEDAFASKAQIGLISDDNLHLQVYNGSSWLDSININNSTGVVNFPQAGVASDLFHKASRLSHCFTVTGAGTLSVNAGTLAWVAGVLLNFASSTSVTMPTLSAGTDYAVYICTDGTIRADASFTAPSGYTTSNSRMIGGFHYAPGGNSAGTSGGNTTPAINPYSVWDLKWRPAVTDPRGMALVNNGFWVDIYLLNAAPDVNGTSAYNVAIASGTTPPKIPAVWGGNGTTAYSGLTWWQANECVRGYGKDLLSIGEFCVAAYGTTEASSLSADPVSTGVSAGTYTSKWGVMQATGCYWVWAKDYSVRWDGTGGFQWVNQAEGRGQQYIGGNIDLVAAVVGGSFGYGAVSGSRSSYWYLCPWNSYGGIGARGRCDHLILG